jgi:predicted exporter
VSGTPATVAVKASSTTRRLAWLWALAVLVLIGHNAYLWLGKRVVPDTDILALLPVQQRDPVLQQSFDHMVEASQQRVIVLVGAPRWEDAVRAAAAYRARLATRPGLLTAVDAGSSAEQDWLAPFAPHRMALLTAQQEQRLRQERARFWVDAALAQLYSAFSGPKLGAFQDDPFGLFAGWVQERAGETPVRPRDGLLFVADGARQYVVMPMILNVPAFSMDAQKVVAPLLAAAAGDARAAAPEVKVISAGVVLHAAAASTQANREVETIGAGSLIGVVLLTWLTFRSLRPIVLVLTSVAVGFLGSMSICWLLFDRIHLLTLVFGASLIGVAQDYGIYFLCNRLGAEPALDSPGLLKRLLPGLYLTLLAAVIGYAGLGFTPFPGLRHMAVFSACGLIFAWLTVVLWFPALVGPHSLRAGPLARRYTDLLARWPRVQRSSVTLALLVLCGVFSAHGWSRLTVNDDIRSLQTPPRQLLDDQIALGKLMEAATPVQYFLVRGASAEQVLQREEVLKARLDEHIAAGRLAGYQAISNWVPSSARQAARRQLVQDQLLQGGGPLALLAKEIGEDPAWVEATRARLSAMPAPLTAEGFMTSPASEPWRHLWLGRTGGGYASIVALRGFAMAAAPRLRTAGDGLAGVQWVDKVAEISSVLGSYRATMGWTVVAAYGLVLALLVPRYKRRAWRVLLPTALASILTVAIMGVLGHSLQLFHVLALLLLLGIGVDYGVFMHEHPVRRDSTAWLAVGLSAVSTILSFGLLALSQTPPLRNFGLTMLIGTTLAWLMVTFFTEYRKEGAHAPLDQLA